MAMEPVAVRLDGFFEVELSLAAAARGNADVKDVNFALHWMTAHNGDYDVQTAYGWLKCLHLQSDGIGPGDNASARKGRLTAGF